MGEFLRLHYTLSKVERDRDAVKIFYLSPDSEPLLFKEGQFVNLYLVNDGKWGEISRPYSIASSSFSRDLRFVIKITGGAFTSLLDKITTGQKIGVEGPFGHFYYKDEPKAVFFAAGTGIAPILSILERIAKTKKKGEFVLFFSNKKRESLPCTSLLEEIISLNPSIKVVYTLTQESPEDWNGELGRINEEMVRKYVDVSDASIYICGPLGFVKSMRDISISLGADEKKVYFEGWG